MIGDMPSIGASTYGATTSTFALGQQAGFAGTAQGGLGIGAGKIDAQQAIRAAQNAVKQEKPAMTPRRLVQVFIADPDGNIPLDQSLLYNGEQKLTDATDQELYFEVDIKTILEKHNAERVKIVNKKVKERVEYLEPVKIRELKMVVVTVAQF